MQTIGKGKSAEKQQKNQIFTENNEDIFRVTFLRESNVMLKLTHKNVIKLYGVATQKEPIMIVMELASGRAGREGRGRRDNSEGSLISRLRATPKKELDTKRKYCKQIANGMAYLEKQQAWNEREKYRNQPTN